MAQSKNTSSPITMPFSPTRQEPESSWAHYEVWNTIRGLLSALPNHFSTELLIRGINATEIFAIGSALSAIVETQVVGILNKLRPIWDAQNQYADYAFVRQSQTFPDVLLQHRTNERDIIFGIELKSWYVLSKEGEPSFRYQVTPKACAEADLLLVIPWILSDVISGTPKVLQPYTELALYAAEYRNFYWQRSRLDRGEVAGITVHQRQIAIRTPVANKKPRMKQRAIKVEILVILHVQACLMTIFMRLLHKIIWASNSRIG
jgi:hypothetical protein